MIRYAIPHVLKRLGLALLLVGMSMGVACAQESADCTTMPPATAITDGTGGVWTLSAVGLVQLNGVTAAQGIVTSVLYTGHLLYIVSGGTYYKQNLQSPSDWLVYGATAPGCTAPPPPPPPDDVACSNTTNTDAVTAGVRDLSWLWAPNGATSVSWATVINGTVAPITPTLVGAVCSGTMLVPYHAALAVPAGVLTVSVQVMTDGGSATSDADTVTATSPIGAPLKPGHVKVR